MTSPPFRDSEFVFRGAKRHCRPPAPPSMEQAGCHGVVMALSAHMMRRAADAQENRDRSSLSLRCCRAGDPPDPGDRAAVDLLSYVGLRGRAGGLRLARRNA